MRTSPLIRKAGIAALATITATTLIGGIARAAETITYSYDAKGRLVKIEHAGTVNNNVKSEYSYDKADNRKTSKVTGAP